MKKNMLLEHTKQLENKCFLQEKEIKSLEMDNAELNKKVNKLSKALTRACKNMETMEQIVYEASEEYRENCTKMLSADEWKAWLLKYE